MAFISKRHTFFFHLIYYGEDLGIISEDLPVNEKGFVSKVISKIAG